MGIQKNIDKFGYKKNSPFKEEPFLKINSNSISMKDVKFPIVGVSLNTGESKHMAPENDYFFPNTSQVLEFPLKENRMQFGGSPKQLKSKDSEELSDEEVQAKNKTYFIERVDKLGIEGAIKEYQKHFTPSKRKYSIRKK